MKFNMKFNSIKFRMPLYFSLFAVICVLVTGSIFLFIFRQKLEENIVNKNMVISEMVSSELHIYLENATETVVTAANFSTQSNGDLNKIKDEIFRIYDNFDYFDLIFYMNEDAKMVFSKPSNENVQDRIYTDRDYYWAVIKHGQPTTLSRLLVSSVLKKPHFIIAAPVKNNEGVTTGLIGAGITLDNIEEIVNNVDVGFNGKLWLCDKQGNLFIHPDYKVEESLIPIDVLNISQISNGMKIQQVINSRENKTIKYNSGDHSYYGSVSFVDDGDWMVVVEQNKLSVKNQIFDSVQRLMWILVYSVVIAMISGIIMANWITRPIQQLVGQVRLLPHFINIKSERRIKPISGRNDEIHELSSAFQDMENRLVDNIDALEEAVIRENHIKQYLNNILASVHSAIIVADSDGRITMMNAVALKMTEITRDKMFDYTLHELLDKLEIDIYDKIRLVIEDDALIKDAETTMRIPSGIVLDISYTCSRVTDENGINIGTVLQIRDITELKIIERDLREEDRIHTLDEFSASIIHDIGNPLAGMSNLVELLKNPELNGSSQDEVLDILSEEIRDLNLLVINFLDLVRSNDVERDRKNLVKILRNCIELFRNEIESAGLDLVITLPDEPIWVMIEARSIKQALINIIKNAIQASEEGGEISITITSEEKVYRLEIADQGEGMDEETKAKLFHPFYTTKEDGTGLGLFVAYNVFKENNCTLSVESEQNVGTRFSIIFKREN